MATYSITQILNGYNGVYEDCDRRERTTHTAESCTVLYEIICDEGESELIIPSHDGEYALTHVGYTQGFRPAHEEWDDWHHCKGGMRIPDQYFPSPISLNVPASVKRITIPKTVKSVSQAAFEGLTDVIFEVHPDNPYLTVVDNKIVWKKK